MPRVLGTGLLALDLIVQHGPDGERLSASGGGTCGNVLVILARAGWEASWLGSMDTSPPGRMVLDEMHRGGVRTHTSDNAAPAPIFAHHIHTDADGKARHWFSDTCPVCARRLPRYARPSDDWLRRQARHVDTADVFFADRLSAGTLELAHIAYARGALVVYEPSSASDAPWMDQMIALADVVKFSSDRASALRGAIPSNERALWLETRGQKGLRWSLGRVGAYNALTPAMHNPAAIDACGAGDWLTSALLIGLAQTRRKPADLDYAQLSALMQYASGVAAWSCGFLGARGGLYDASISALLAQLHAPPTLDPASLPPLARPVPRVGNAGHCVYA